MQELRELEDERKKMATLIKENEEKTKEQITLDVGGKRFKTTKTTLMNQESYFSGLVRSGCFKVRSPVFETI